MESASISGRRPALDLTFVRDLRAVADDVLAAAADVHGRAFAQPPYLERYTPKESRDSLERVLREDGIVVLGAVGGRMAALAAGRPKPPDTFYPTAHTTAHTTADTVFYIDELAVAPEFQGNGYGRRVLRALTVAAAEAGWEFFEIRTTAKNSRAIGLYESEGFSLVAPNEVVSHTRDDGGIRLDERVHLVRRPADEGREPAGAPPGKLRRVVVAYPSGNTTAILFDQLLDADRKALNDAVGKHLGHDRPDLPPAEQCCFVTLPRDPRAMARVEMFGGEFCGNATRSVLWVVAGGAAVRDGLVESSGVRRPLRFDIRDGEVRLEMPLSTSGDAVRQVPEGVVVRFDGIAQLVVTDDAVRTGNTPRDVLGSLLSADRHGFAAEPAAGVTFFDPATDAAEFCVWVRDVETVFDETACGSGTSAIGAALAVRERRSVERRVAQPSGDHIVTHAEFAPSENTVSASWIRGAVKCLYDGEVQLS
jgi:ribosomal protein S18 acetylase RimI-like enzyme/diaminopimelate epimerase